MAQVFSNNASGILSSTAGVSSTSMSLVTGDGANFPSLGPSDYFLATLIGLDNEGREAAWEIVKVTSNSGDVLTVERAQEGTTASIWASGTTIELRLTAGLLTELSSNPSSESGLSTVSLIKMGIK